MEQSLLQLSFSFYPESSQHGLPCSWSVYNGLLFPWPVRCGHALISPPCSVCSFIFSSCLQARRREEDRWTQSVGGCGTRTYRKRMATSQARSAPVLALETAAVSSIERQMSMCTLSVFETLLSLYVLVMQWYSVCMLLFKEKLFILCECFVITRWGSGWH